MWFRSPLLLAMVLGAAPAAAAEVATYSYDALGRLTNTSRSGGPSNGRARATSYDASDNRIQSTLSGGALAKSAPDVASPIQQSLSAKGVAVSKAASAKRTAQSLSGRAR